LHNNDKDMVFPVVRTQVWGGVSWCAASSLAGSAGSGKGASVANGDNKTRMEGKAEGPCPFSILDFTPVGTQQMLSGAQYFACGQMKYWMTPGWYNL
jgi:hypothetical protein